MSISIEAQDTSTDAGSTLTRVLQIAPQIAKSAADTDRDGRPPAELFEELTDAGCYRMLAPASHGGDELPVTRVLEVVEALSQADGSVGWVVGQAAIAQLVFSYFPPSTVERIYAGGPDVVGAGAVAPKGKALRAPGGWRVSGQWPFVTGSDRASWIYLQCVALGDDVEPTAPGMPALQLMLFPVDEVTILDTWHVLGLRGTASNDVQVRAQCPDERSTRLVGAGPALDRPAYRIPTVEYGGLVIAAAAVGIARAAIDDVVALATGGKRPAFATSRLAESEVFADRVGEAHMAVEGARSLLYTQAGVAWSAARRGHPLPPATRATIRGAVTATVAAARDAVDLTHGLGGGSTVYDGSALERRLRDIHTASQHAAAGRHSYLLLGRALLGQDSPLLRM